ncbi:RelA/SpoT domain-containing protein [Heyndrickxia coagulans]|uniref:RelA/SpoT domain-containing protein n=3 Tax=Heyndrickxia TaxID=2837504 RepID=A0AAN0T5V5_HEYCO|nr:RelA/SpoT domain-containing protein [Heyndrickxia coagulans]
MGITDLHCKFEGETKMEVAIPIDFEQMKEVKTELTRFMMSYKFALHEVMTKIDILKEEFQYVHDYNPIEHVKSRLKSPESILNKAYRKGCALSLDSIRENIRDIAGIRITCSFISDIYEISKMIQQQKDVKLIECKDYIQNPKPNGYQSLHMIIKIPVFMSDRSEEVYVEIQIRTIAMDFWASLEHKIYYKYDEDVPQHLKEELKEAALQAAQLDVKMENIQKEMKEVKKRNSENSVHQLIVDTEKLRIPEDFLKAALNETDGKGSI